GGAIARQSVFASGQIAVCGREDTLESVRCQVQGADMSPDEAYLLSPLELPAQLHEALVREVDGQHGTGVTGEHCGEASGPAPQFADRLAGVGRTGRECRFDLGGLTPSDDERIDGRGWGRELIV